MSDSCDFSSKLLFEQKANLEEGKFVYSRVHAISYMYPGAVTHTTARARTTIVYAVEDFETIVYGGTIEKWSDKGWQVIEEFFDARPVFKSEIEAQDYMLALYKSFTLGLPIAYKTPGDDDEPKPKPVKKAKKDKNPKLRVLSFGKHLKNQGLENSYDNYESKSKKDDKDKPEKDDDDDSPDFDWI